LIFYDFFNACRRDGVVLFIYQYESL